MSAQRKKQKSAQIVRSVSKLAGTLTGTTVGIGKKAPGFRAFVKVKTLAAKLESELAVTNRKLNSTRNKTKETQSQLKTLQTENEALNSALKQAQNKARGIKNPD